MSKNVLDHQQAFKVLLEHYKIDKFLEFGLGAGTQFFLDNCSHVTSVELSWDRNTKWFNRCKSGYRNYSNWDAHFFVLPEKVCVAERAIRAGHSDIVYTLDDGYLPDLQRVVEQFVPEGRFNVVFVDPGTHLRADIVNLLFGRTDIIVAHDTNQTPEYYGWDRIRTPDNYDHAKFATRAGVKLWFQRDKSENIKRLQQVFDSTIDYQNTGVVGFATEEDLEWLHQAVKRLPQDAIIVELGSFQGLSAVAMGAACRGSNRHIYCVDCWEGTIRGDKGQPIDAGAAYPKFVENIQRFGLDSFVTPIKKLTVSAAADFDQPVDMLFVDAAHEYKPVLADLKAWVPKVKQGGIICGHDWDRGYFVDRAVVEYFGKHMIVKQKKKRFAHHIWDLIKE